MTDTHPLTTGGPSEELTDDAPQASVAVAVPRLAVAKSTVHSTTTLGGHVIAGGVLSLTVIV